MPRLNDRATQRHGVAGLPVSQSGHAALLAPSRCAREVAWHLLIEHQTDGRAGRPRACPGSRMRPGLHRQEPAGAS
jgi:hypothetical protein